MAINNTKTYPFFVGMPPGSPTKMTWIDPTTVPAGPGPYSSVLYVDPVRGNDATGSRGNASLPFATVQAALNAMQSADTIVCAPMLITVTATLTIPATVVRGGIAGAYEKGTSSATPPSGTTIRSTTVDLFNLGANLGLQKWTFANLTMSSSLTCVQADGSIYARNGFLGGGLSFDNIFAVGTTAVLNAKYVVAISVDSGQLSGPMLHVNGGVFALAGCRADGVATTIAYDLADPLTTTQVASLNVQNGTVLGGTLGTAFVTWSGQSRIFVDGTSTIGGLKASALSVNGATVPAISCCGSIAGGNSLVLDLASAGSELPDTATALVVDFRGTRFFGLFQNATQGVVGPTTIKAKVAGAAVNAQTVKLDSTTALPSTTFTADANINMTMRGADAPLATLTTPAGTGTLLPPSPLLLAPIAVAAAPQPVTLPCRIPAGSTAFLATYQSDNAGSVPTSVITARTQTGFSAGLVAAGGGNITAQVAFPG